MVENNGKEDEQNNDDNLSRDNAKHQKRFSTLIELLRMPNHALMIKAICLEIIREDFIQKLGVQHFKELATELLAFLSSKPTTEEAVWRPVYEAEAARLHCKLSHDNYEAVKLACDGSADARCSTLTFILHDLDATLTFETATKAVNLFLSKFVFMII